MGSNPISSTSWVGACAELSVARALVAAGHHVFVPLFGADSRIDLVYAYGSNLRRVQCKTSRLRGDVVTFWTCSNTAQIRKGYDGDVDEFGVYSPELDAVFLVPIGDVPTRMASLRLAPARNGQERNIRWAADYVLGGSDTLRRARTRPGSRSGAVGTPQ